MRVCPTQTDTKHDEWAADLEVGAVLVDERLVVELLHLGHPLVLGSWSRLRHVELCIRDDDENEIN